MNIKNLMQFIRNKNPKPLETDCESLVRALLRRTYCNTVLAEMSATPCLEEKYVILALISALQYGVSFQRNYCEETLKGSRFDTSPGTQYLAISYSIFNLLQLHKEGKPHETLDTGFSRLVNELSAFAKSKGFNLENDVVESFCNHSESALPKDSDSN